MQTSRIWLTFDPVEEAARQWETHGWAEYAPGMASVLSIMRTQQILLSWADQVLKVEGLTFARYEALMLLSFSRKGELPMGKIGARLQVHPASVTNAITRLEADGYVKRRQHNSDGRVVLAAITKKGRRVADKATTAMNNEVFRSIGLSQRNMADLIRILRELRHAAYDFEIIHE